jgi:chromosome segregation protein
LFLTQDKQSKERADFAIKSLVKEKDTAERALEDLRSKLAGLRNDHEEQKQKTQHLQEEVQSLDQLVRNKQTEVYNLTKSIEVKEIQVNTFKQELEKTATDTHQRSISLVEFEKKTQELEKELASQNKLLNTTKDKEDRLEVRIADTEKTVEVLRDETSELKRKIDSRQNEYNLTKSMIDNLEGFPEAIKFLKKESGWGKKVPLLSDIIACPDEYRVTIENYLDPYMNYYVVGTVDDAYKAVEILSDAAKGKANFFVVDSLEKYSPAPTRIYDNAFPASEVVEYDSKYRKLISYILDNVYIVDGDYHTVPKDDESTFITRNGKITKRRHSVSGGSVGLFEGKKIGRIKNLEKLEKELKKLTKQLDTVERSYVEKQKELTDLKSSTHRDEIESLQQKISTVNAEYISIKTKQEQFSDMLSRADLKKEDFVKSIETHTSELAKLRPAEEEGKKELSELSIKLEELSEELRKQNDVLSEKSSAFNQENIFFHQQENRVQSIEQELGFKKTSLESSDERIKKNQEELRTNESEIKQLIENSASQDEDLIGMYTEKEKFEGAVNEAEKDFYSVRGQIDETEKSQRELQRSRENRLLPARVSDARRQHLGDPRRPFKQQTP